MAVALLGMIPIMWSIGTGADVMKPIAAPDDRRHDLVGGARADHDPGNIRTDEEEGTQEWNVEVFGYEALR